jgi:choice-of-anchor C domain-containing protein
MRTHVVTFSLPLLLAAVTALHCGAPQARSTETGTVAVGVSLQALSVNDIASVSVVISGDHISPDITYDLVKTRNQWRGIISNIPAAPGRTVHAKARNNSGVTLYEGTATPVTIEPNTTAQVNIILQQSQAPKPFSNTAPFIHAVSASADKVAPGATVRLAANASDADGDPLSYAWSAKAGTFNTPEDSNSTWTAPSVVGTQVLTLTVSDNRSGSRTITLSIDVQHHHADGAASIDLTFNHWPVVSLLSASPSRMLPGEWTQLSLAVSDTDGDALSYAWSDSGSACAGSFNDPRAQNPRWTAPLAMPPGERCTLIVSVTDGRGGTGTGSLDVWISNKREINVAPTVMSAFQSTDDYAPREQVVFRVRAEDPEGGEVRISWSASAGSLDTTTGGEVVWTAPATCGPVTLTAKLTDPEDLATLKEFSLGCSAPTLVNGGFEQGPALSTRYIQLNQGNTSLTGWTVLSQNVEYMGSLWVAAEGQRSIDLSGTAPGGLSQELQTVPGRTYVVSFSMAGDPTGSQTKSMRVEAAGQSQNYTFDISGRTTQDMGWISQSFTFTAQSTTTTLAFKSLTSGYHGPTLDNVSIAYAP